MNPVFKNSTLNDFYIEKSDAKISKENCTDLFPKLKTIVIISKQWNQEKGIKKLELELNIQATAGQNILTGKIKYSIKNSSYKLINCIVIKKRNTKILESILARLKKNIERGEIITETTTLETYEVLK